ncbi:hypothetical protein Jiend_55380 [Micromonospora endophytica]|nr:hypothetical protein Jiend_55380 [Micromonospora endophytica]
MLLHGYLQDSRVWQPMVDHLPSGITSITPDLPLGGHRQTSPTPTPTPGRRATSRPCQRRRGAARVGQRACGAQVVREAFGDGVVGRMGSFERVRHA